MSVLSLQHEVFDQFQLKTKQKKLNYKMILYLV